MGSRVPPSIDGSHVPSAPIHRNALLSAARSLFLRRRETTRELRGFEHPLLASLEAGRCPTCAELESHDDHYFFRLLTESYQEIGMHEQVARSLGYCPRHGQRLLQDAAYGAAVTHLHRVALVDLDRRLSGARCARRPSGPGPSGWTGSTAVRQGASVSARWATYFRPARSMLPRRSSARAPPCRASSLPTFSRSAAIEPQPQCASSSIPVTRTSIPRIFP